MPQHLPHLSEALWLHLGIRNVAQITLHHFQAHSAAHFPHLGQIGLTTFPHHHRTPACTFSELQGGHRLQHLTQESSTVPSFSHLPRAILLIQPTANLSPTFSPSSALSCLLFVSNTPRLITAQSWVRGYLLEHRKCQITHTEMGRSPALLY